MNKGGNHSVGSLRPLRMKTSFGRPRTAGPRLSSRFKSLGLIEPTNSLNQAGPALARPSRATAGFTIIETLIVLAVTSSMFISIALLINGRQAKTQFMTAINNVQQQIQQVINQTATGYFPNTNNFTCSATTGTPPQIDDSTSGQGQGTNTGCIFLGKVMFLDTDPADNSDGNQQFITWPIVGNQNITSTADQTINKAFPSPVDPVSESTVLTNGLTATAMQYVDATGAHDTAGVGFLAGDSTGLFAGSNSTGNGLVSGSQQLSLYGITNVGHTGLGTQKSAMQTALTSTSPTANNYQNATSVTICLHSGTTDQSGLFTIGNTGGVGSAANRQMTVTLKIYGDAQCGA